MCLPVTGQHPRPSLRTPALGARPYPAFGGLGGSNFNGISNYDSLQLDVRKRYSYGLTFDVNYAWSHMLDDQTRPDGAAPPGKQVWQIGNNPSSNYGNSKLRHSASAQRNRGIRTAVWHGQALYEPECYPRRCAWRMAHIGTFIYQDGTPFTVLDSGVNDYSQAGNVFANPTGTPPTQAPAPMARRYTP